MRIETLVLDRVKPSPRNPRVIPGRAVEEVAKSIKQFGFLVPVVIDEDDVLLAGHTRLMAARLNGLEKIPCVRAKDLTVRQKDMFRLADNRVSEITSWDEPKLFEVLMSLGEELPPGFMQDDLDELKRLNDGGGWAGEDPGDIDEDEETGESARNDPDDLIPVTFRCRRKHREEVNSRCKALILEIEQGG